MVTALLVGCSGSSAVEPPAESRPPAPSATVLPHHGGLVGAIDSARLVALCENVRLAATAVDGGLPASSVDQAFTGALEVLRQAPVDPTLVRLADKWKRLRQRSGDTVAVDAMTAFCAREGGQG